MSYILKYISYKKVLSCIICSVLMLSSIYLVFIIQHNFSEYKKVANPYLLEKVKNYVLEKMVRFYDIKNETPYLDSNYLSITDEYCNIWTPIDSPESCTYTETCIYVPEKYGIKNYYSFVYNKIPDIQICFTDDAIEKFYNNGGYFTKEEIAHISFNDLLNDDYIIYTKGEKLSLDEISKLMKEPVNKTEM